MTPERFADICRRGIYTDVELELIDALAARDQQLAALREGLASHEWEPRATVSGARALFCPACHNPKAWSSDFTRERAARTDRPDGHRPGCWLAIALEAARALLAQPTGEEEHDAEFEQAAATDQQQSGDAAQQEGE